MSRLTDAITELEYDLSKYPGDTEDDALSRRLVIRKAFTSWGDERFAEGYSDGRADEREARREAKRRAEGKDEDRRV